MTYQVSKYFRIPAGTKWRILLLCPFILAVSLYLILTDYFPSPGDFSYYAWIGGKIYESGGIVSTGIRKLEVLGLPYMLYLAFLTGGKSFESGFIFLRIIGVAYLILISLYAYKIEGYGVAIYTLVLHVISPSFVVESYKHLDIIWPVFGLGGSLILIQSKKRKFLFVALLLLMYSIIIKGIAFPFLVAALTTKLIYDADWDRINRKKTTVFVAVMGIAFSVFVLGHLSGANVKIYYVLRQIFKMGVLDFVGFYTKGLWYYFAKFGWKNSMVEQYHLGLGFAPALVYLVFLVKKSRFHTFLALFILLNVPFMAICGVRNLRYGQLIIIQSISIFGLVCLIKVALATHARMLYHFVILILVAFVVLIPYQHESSLLNFFKLKKSSGINYSLVNYLEESEEIRHVGILDESSYQLVDFYLDRDVEYLKIKKIPLFGVVSQSSKKRIAIRLQTDQSILFAQIRNKRVDHSRNLILILEKKIYNKFKGKYLVCPSTLDRLCREMMNSGWKKQKKIAGYYVLKRMNLSQSQRMADKTKKVILGRRMKKWVRSVSGGKVINET
jgi:hypothetical protein